MTLIYVENVVSTDDGAQTESSEPPKKKTKKVPKVLDGTYYTIESNIDGKIDAKCTECGKILKGDLGSTGNYKSHYLRLHKAAFKQLEEYLTEEASTLENENCVPKNSKQPGIRDMLAPVSDEKVLKRIIFN